MVFIQNIQEEVNNTDSYLPAVRSALEYIYYDDYSFAGASSRAFNVNTDISGYSSTAGNNNYCEHVGGLVTGTKVKVLDDTDNNWILTVNYYDDNSRPIQVVRNLYPLGENVISIKYDFVGNILQTREYQNYSGNSNTIDKYYKYDHVGRLLSIEESRNDGIRIELCELTYDDSGKLKDKELHDGLDTLSYSYNIRNWLKKIDGNKFEMDLFYNDVTSFGRLDTMSQYNGNISAMRWCNKGIENVYRNYAFKYDGISRLLKADYGEGLFVLDKSDYDVTGISYDKNGNILGLSRKEGGVDIDRLSYGYIGNKLKYVNDSGNDGAGFKEQLNSTGNEYLYDDNGNMTKDLNKGISNIAYNFLNLPKQINKGNDVIKYIYSARGEKLQNIVSSNKTLSYCGSFVYENGSLKYIQNEEGRYVVEGGIGKYEYNLKDHLGNVRMVIDEYGNVCQTNNYYPYGMTFATSGASSNKYLYNGKELQELTDYLDFGARQYQADLGRWFNTDPLAEMMAGISPYSYCYNNPLNYQDVMGLYPEQKFDGGYYDSKSGRKLRYGEVEFWVNNGHYPGEREIDDSWIKWQLSGGRGGVYRDKKVYISYSWTKGKKDEGVVIHWEEREFLAFGNGWYEKDGFARSGEVRSKYSAIKDGFAYIYHAGSSNTKSMAEIFNFESRKKGTYHTINFNNGVRFNFYPQDIAIPKNLKFYIPDSGKTILFIPTNTDIENFPKGNKSHPYGIRIIGDVNGRYPSVFGTLYFNNFNTFKNYVEYIYYNGQIPKK